MSNNSKSEENGLRYYSYQNDLKTLCEKALIVCDFENELEKNELEKLLYQHLLVLSRKYKQKLTEKDGHSVFNLEISTKTLVQELYIKLFNSKQSWEESEQHILMNVVNAIRTLIFQLAREINSEKRRKYLHAKRESNFDLYSGQVMSETDRVKTIMLHEAINNLKEVSSVSADTYLLKYFAGFSEDEIADLFNTNRYTVRKSVARAECFIQKAVGIS